MLRNHPRKKLNAKKFPPSTIANGKWKWPRGRNAAIIEIMVGTASDLVPAMDRDVRIIWTLTPNGSYSATAKSAWQAIRFSKPEVEWSPLVWYSKHVPRWSFILWVTTILGRLPTKDRLRSWGIAVDSNCVLFHGGLEGHNHLFFDCSFANLVWKAVKSWCDWGHVSRTLEVKLQWGYASLL